MKRTTIGLGFAAIMLAAPAACTSEEEDPDDWGSGGGTASGGAGGHQDPSGCRSVQCAPPPCCGDGCTSTADCCDGTVCSATGRCIPSSCVGCGELGCLVDFDACSAECAPADCCLEACTTDSDCCAGTRCRESVGGGWKCYPDSCDSCGGMRPLCATDPTTCTTSCEAPAVCGDECQTDADCDAFTVCNDFTSGAKKCVPRDFTEECSWCGTSCSFYGSTCEVECGGSGGTGGAAGVGGTGGSGGSVSGGSGGVAEDSGAASGGAPSCARCCEPCSTDSDCCGGSVCYVGDGNPRCVPASCGACDWGCTYYCPS